MGLLDHGSALLDGRLLEAQELLQAEPGGDGHGHRRHPLRRRPDAFLGDVSGADSLALGPGDSAGHALAQGGLLHWQDREGGWRLRKHKSLKPGCDWSFRELEYHACAGSATVFLADASRDRQISCAGSTAECSTTECHHVAIRWSRSQVSSLSWESPRFSWPCLEECFLAASSYCLAFALAVRLLLRQ